MSAPHTKPQQDPVVALVQRCLRRGAVVRLSKYDFSFLHAAAALTLLRDLTRSERARLLDLAFRVGVAR
jgi:hypothetical protein